MFPAVFLVVLVQTVVGVAGHSGGARAVAGYAAVAGFVACYLLALVSVTGERRGFVTYHLVLYALFAVGLWTAHEDAFPMAIFLGVLAIARFGRRFVWIALGLVAADVALPAVFHWPERGQAFSLVIVLAANYAFFRLLWANVALHQARAELAGLAAEGERQRIARDLHDLLGHSLTTITVKSALARRLADAGEVDRSRAEVAEIEEIARRP
ncbi:MAG: histidine kinase [Acidimicrobiales bacterium]